jgi:hypothetical protein
MIWPSSVNTEFGSLLPSITLITRWPDEAFCPLSAPATGGGQTQL